MAMVKGLDVGTVIWKEIEVVKVPKREERRRENGTTFFGNYVRDKDGNVVYEDLEQYYLYKVYNRRCRTEGASMKEELYPFFDKLKIRLNAYNHYRPGNYYTAVGITRSRVQKEEYDNTEVSEVAQKHYARLTNEDCKIRMLKDELRNDDFLLKELIQIREQEEVPDDDDEKWPTEPPIRTFHVEYAW